MIGRVSEIGTGVTEWRVEERAGTTWLASVCGAWVKTADEILAKAVRKPQDYSGARH